MEGAIEVASGFSEVMLRFEKRVAALDHPEKLLRGAVANLYVLISDRIQQHGQASDGSLIGGGVYSPKYSRYRAKKGRQTAFVDLTFTGDMLDRGFIYGPVPAGGFGLGFANKMSADRMALLEQRYGQQIISPTVQERENALVDILDAIRDQIRNPDR
jgi:hypothetical protein